ncbi:MAG TPA: FUSC family membrane protein [Hanamia sp.]
MAQSQKIRYFLFSQYLADGIRITLEIIIPAVVFSYLGHLDIGITLSLGALCVSIADGPGPVIHKRNGMLYCNIFIFISAVLTGLCNGNIILMGILILAASFFFTMFSVYGSRATTVGFATLLLMVLRMTEIIPSGKVLEESLLILGGGIWYMVVALLLFRITPYRPAQRSLGDCIHETAKYLLIKSELYEPHSEIDELYSRLIKQQVTVVEKQDVVRELLFKNRSLLKESTRTARLLVLTFVDVVDIFEQMMASWYDYSSLRKKFSNTGIPEQISFVIKNIANEMDGIGEAIQSNNTYKRNFDLAVDLKNLKQKVDQLPDEQNTIMLKKVLVNLRSLGEKTDDILKYFQEDISAKGNLRSRTEYSRFVTHQKINGAVFRNNLNFKSNIFRHSLRVMITCGVGYALSKLLLNGHHSYWILMTIIIILKPAYGLTKQKNSDRLLGTIAGGIIGLLLLYFVKDKALLFACIVFFMLGTYTYKTLNYIVMVIFLTPYILILFHFLGLGAIDVAGERLMDTSIGSALAFLASYFLFPQWESESLQKYMVDVLKANIKYLGKLKIIFTGSKISTLDYKLLRKELFVSTANLAGALHRTLSEPKSKQGHVKEIYEFVVLNNVLSSNIASLTAAAYNQEKHYPKQFLIIVNNAFSLLEGGLQKLDNSYFADIKKSSLSNSFDDTTPVNVHEKDQLDFIYKVSGDIKKITDAISE